MRGETCQCCPTEEQIAQMLKEKADALYTLHAKKLEELNRVREEAQAIEAHWRRLTSAYASLKN